MLETIKNAVKTLVAIGVHEKLTTLEQGLVKLTNKAALTILLVVSFVFVPMRILTAQYSSPILILFAFLFSLTLLFNYRKKFLLARHYLIALLYIMLLVVSVLRGIESGILFILIPTVLLAYIFFYPFRSLYFHLVLILAFTTFILIYGHGNQPILPHPAGMLSKVYAIYLLISLALSAVFVDFIFTLNRRYQQELLSLNQTKNKLLGIIGHDLRSPLNSLKGLLQLVNYQNLSQEEFHGLIKQLSRSTENLSYSLDNLLEWAVTQLKGITASPAPFRLRQVSEQECSLLEEGAKQKDIRILNRIPEEITAYADINHIGLVIRNLLNNAIKFTPKGGRIILEARPEAQQVVVRISDTGIGMEKALATRIFNRENPEFSRGTGGESGLGLGLMLCKEMIIHNKGKIWARSEKGKGSTFTFSLPVQEPSNKAASPLGRNIKKTVL